MIADVREVENLGRRAVVLLEPHDFAARKVLLEVEDVPDVGAAPAVDRLVVVADDADVAVLAAEQLDELVLRAVRVLVLVDEDVLKAVAIVRERRLVLPEHLAPAARADRRRSRRSLRGASAPVGL